jgi:hypothetical protein
MGIPKFQVNSNLVRNTLSEKTNDDAKNMKANNKNADNKNADGSGQVANGSINANELNLTGQTDAEKKALLAQKTALQIKLDQFDKDSSLDSAVKRHETDRDNNSKDAENSQKEVSNLEALKQDIKKTSGVADDSEEQKNLELLEKKLKGKEPLTAEERAQIENMGPLTEYQEAALRYDLTASVWQERADIAREDAINESRTVTAINLARLPLHGMYDANQKAEKVLEVAEAQIKQQITDDAKETIDEKLGDDKEPDKNDIQAAKIQSLLDKHIITEEDIKGLLLDQKL